MLKRLGLLLASSLYLGSLLSLHSFLNIFRAQVFQEFPIYVILCQILELFVDFAGDSRAVIVDIS